ncbi:MAG: hypothetical protein HQ402_01835 [Parcubacteria group bacterium]|nr:hypothetical protein [Parcubacteria group bacterium]
MKYTNKKRGFLKMILVVIVALALLKFVFHFDIIDFFNSPKAQETVKYVLNVVKIVWEYIRVPFLFVWDRANDFIRSYR